VSGAIVVGGYGTFGLLVARELAALGVPVTVAGRDRTRAERTAVALGPGHRAQAVDLASADSCREALRGHAVAVNCAGDLTALAPHFLDACLEAGCHYADIAVERPHTAMVRGRAEDFRRRGLSAIHGCSSLPAISGALALTARGPITAAPRRARVTLFIGNDNPKGRGAIESLVRTLGKPIRAPQGVLHGFRDREVVPMPHPFGRRAVFNFDSPEYDLFPDLLGVRSVSVKVGFELRLATYGFALLALLGRDYGTGLVDWLERGGRWLRGVGSSGGAVMSELFWADGSTRRAALVARRDGQRMASLPCALVVHALTRGAARVPGAWAAYEFLGAEGLLRGLTRHGFRVHRWPPDGSPTHDNPLHLPELSR
jgi:hypothetical protein